MVYRLRWTPRAQEQFAALEQATSRQQQQRQGRGKSSKAGGLFKQVVKALSLLRSNPRHPGLQTHEFFSLTNPFDSKGKVFEAYAQNRTSGAYRIFWCYGPQKSEITILAITPHP